MIEQNESGNCREDMNLLEKTFLVCGIALTAVTAPAVNITPKPGADAAPGRSDQEIPDTIRRDAVVTAVERAMPSVVNIATETLVKVRDPFEQFFQEFWSPYHQQQQQVRSQYNLGSGVIIDEDGYLVTNDHVVRRADKIQIQLATSKDVYEAKLIASDPKNDIALLKINAPPGTKFTAIKFAPNDDLLLGETVLALGNPFGLGGSVSRGILSSKSRMRPAAGQDLEIPNCLQTDAAINPGNSGGPLVNLRGELIGVNVAVLEQSGGRIARGIGFAIPIQLVTDALGHAFTPEATRQLWFGAEVRPGTTPLTITAVQAGSPAALAGLKVGDQIQQVNHQTPRSFIQFNELLANSPKPRVLFAIQRLGETKELTVTLVPEKDFFNADLVQRRIGLTLQEITPQLAQTLGLGNTTGLIVAGVEAIGPAAASLKPGAVITAVDGQLPANLTTFAKMLHAKVKGDTARLGVVLQQRQGNFVLYRQGVVEIPVQ